MQISLLENSLLIGQHMEKKELLKILKEGVVTWNQWRSENHELFPDLSGVNLSGANLRGADLRGADLGEANLSGADLSEAYLNRANLSKAILNEADLSKVILWNANLREANFSGVNFSGASLREADLNGANLSGADLSGANLSGAVVVQSNLQNAKLTSCRIYGISAWDVEFSDNTEQQDLIITSHDQPTITVDNLEVAQFISLLLKNDKTRRIIDAITSKVVLILGRFTEERKAVLDALREELHRRDLIPVVFDFDKPASKDVKGTVETIARMARFVIADFTHPGSIPHELAAIVPLLRKTPVLPLRLAGSGGYSLFDELKQYPWVLDIHEYNHAGSLHSNLPMVIAPADEMAEKLHKTTRRPRKNPSKGDKNDENSGNKKVS